MTILTIRTENFWRENKKSKDKRYKLFGLSVETKVHPNIPWQAIVTFGNIEMTFIVIRKANNFIMWK